MEYTVKYTKRTPKEEPIVASFKEIRAFRKLQRERRKIKRDAYDNRQTGYINYRIKEDKQSPPPKKVYQDPLNKLQCFIEYNKIKAERKKRNKAAKAASAGNILTSDERVAKNAKELAKFKLKVGYIEKDI